jgi:hypothetical protein
MKNTWLIIIGLIFLSCNHKENLDKYISELPDSSMMNDVFHQISEIDSFRSDYGISNRIIIPKLYKWTKSDNDSIPPPPPPLGGISFDELFSLFRDDSLNKNRSDDSIFFRIQVDTLRKYSISKNLISRFSDNSKQYYIFYMPIFSFDKQFVLIRYWKRCGGLCGTCHQILLKRENGKWIKIDSRICGKS